MPFGKLQGDCWGSSWVAPGDTFVEAPAVAPGKAPGKGSWEGSWEAPGWLLGKALAKLLGRLLGLLWACSGNALGML